MCTKGPIEIRNLQNVLNDTFGNIIQLSNTGNEDEKKREFYSKSLAAYTLMKITDCSQQDAVNSLIDGNNDCGIDAIYIDYSQKKYYLVQSKYCEKGNSEPSLSDVSKFGNGVDYFLNSKWDNFKYNINFEKRLPDFQKCLATEGMKCYIILVYSSFNELHIDRILIFDNLKYHSSEGYITFKHYNLEVINEWIINDEKQYDQTSISLRFFSPSIVNTPYKVIHGIVDIKEINKLYDDYRDKMIVVNIRNYKGLTQVNNDIIKTIYDKPELFYLYNNGITAYCKQWNIIPRDERNNEEKEIKIYGFRIVNGSQTVGAINEYFLKDNKEITSYVYLKLISLDNCQSDREFIMNLIKYTNSQNRINPEDFIALDPNQIRYHKTLKLQNVYYKYKEEKNNKWPHDRRFDYKESCRALACKYSADYQIIRLILINNTKLYSYDTGISLFRQINSPETLWRLVQIKRIVEKYMKEYVSAEVGLRKEFFSYSKWLILHIIYKQINFDTEENLFLSEEEISILSEKVNEISEIVWNVLTDKGYINSEQKEFYNPSRTVRSIFIDITICDTIIKETLKRINMNERSE
ncbi:MAG: AIPR family protein [Atribacterota bacterium]|nr:AIPR family protein [Atribacterota bacterium]